MSAATTQTETTSANPDGTFTTNLNPMPVRVKHGSAWVPLDATLTRRSDGTYRPGATPAQLSLSGGGTTTLATMVNGGQRLAIGWPTTLPTPTVSANTATYPNVLPRVDLQVTVSEQGGFSHVLIVHDASAAANPQLTSLRLTTTSLDGIAISADEAGNLAATDRFGRTLYTSPTPFMWDSSTSMAPTPDARTNTKLGPDGAETSGPAGPGDGARTAEVGVALDDETLTLLPDSGLLRTGTYPIYIDPTWNANPAKSSRSGWTYVSAAFPNQAYMNNSKYNDGDARAGYQGWESPMGIAHSYFQFAIPSAIWKKHVITATMQLTEKYSSSTESTTLNLYHTGAFGTATTWNIQPHQGALITSVVAGPARSSSEHPQVEFNVYSEINAAARGSWGTTTIGIWNSNESDRDYWRKFENNPTIAITYNSVPNTPANPIISPFVPCAGGFVGNTDVTLSATLSDPDGDQTHLDGIFTVNDSETNTTLAQSTVTVSNNKSAAITYPKTWFTHAHTYTWSLIASDGKDISGRTPTCHMTVDHNQPATPSVTYNVAEDQPARVPITLHLSQPDGQATKSYVYSLNTPPPATIPVSDGAFPGGTLIPAAASGITDVSITPTRIGNNTLYVYSISAAKNPSKAAVRSIITTGLTAPDRNGDFTGEGVPDFIGVGGPSRAGLWLYKGTDRSGHVAATPANVGANGVRSETVGTATAWNGAAVSSADLDTNGAQDVVVKLPVADAAGNVLFVPGTGDGSTFDPSTSVPIKLKRVDGGDGSQALDQAVAMPASSTLLPDLYAIVGDSLYRYRAASIGAYDEPEPLSTGWTGHSITAAGSTTNPALIERNDNTGQLTLWNITLAVDDQTATTATATPLASSGFDRVSTPLLAGADIDTDGRPDLWTVAKNGDLRAYLPALNSPLPVPVTNAVGFVPAS